MWQILWKNLPRQHIDHFKRSLNFLLRGMVRPNQRALDVAVYAAVRMAIPLLPHNDPHIFFFPALLGEFSVFCKKNIFPNPLKIAIIKKMWFTR